MPPNPVRPAAGRSALPPPPFAPLHGMAKSAAQAKPASVIQPMNLRKSTKEKTEQYNLPPPPQTKRLSRRNSLKLEDGSFEIGMDFETTVEFKIPKPKCPKFDQYGNRLLRYGKRSEVSWLNGFLLWYKTNKKPIVCQSTKLTQHNNNDIEIDHKRPFFDQIQSECTKHTVCDGTYHWDAYVIDFHTEELTAGDIDSLGKQKTSVRRAYHLQNNLQWMCQPHNGSKNGTKDHDSLAEPDYLCLCDGESCSDPAP